MSQRKIDKRVKVKKPPEQKTLVSSKIMQVRSARRELEENILYSRIHNGDFVIERKDDPKYVREQAEHLGWSVGRLNRALDRIWAEAKRELYGTGRNETKHNSEVEAGGSEDVCDSSGN